MRFAQTPLEGVVVIDLERHTDERGSFARTFCEREFTERGLPTEYPQCNLSSNRRAGTMRGMHFNADPHGESKIVRCVRGAIHDVVVDLRTHSSTRFQSFGVELSATNGTALFVPVGFAHGFLTLEDDTDVYYHMGAIYHPAAARGVRWDDPVLAIEWPRAPDVMSESDAGYPDIDVASFDLATYEA
jgi:dTDP-4-dehydrorhamnose 3,5-epimerase